MFKNITNLDVESTDHEQRAQNELDPLIQRNVNVPSNQEAHAQVVARAQFLALCWTLFMMGWTNSSTGPLLPTIQNFYDVGFKTASYVFVLPRAGVIVGALLNISLSDRLGLGKMLVVGALFQTAAFLAQFLAPPFPVFALSFALAGIGNVVQSASANGFIAILQKDSEYKQGFIQAAFGFGALAAPLSATYFAQSTIYWSHHYLISFLLAFWNMVVLAGVFKFQSQDECLRQAGEILPDKIRSEGIHEDRFTRLMKNKTVHLLALFLMVYTGIEMTIAGWIVTFLMIVRGGGPSTGYVSTGFFGGLTLGRVVLAQVTKKIGAVKAIYIYTFLAILFQLIVWVVPSLTAAAISVSIIGLLLGPMFPIAINHTARVLPRHMVSGTVGWIAACGAVGNTLLSFITGEMASNLGIEILQPLLFVMMIIMGTLWIFVPKKSKFTC